MDFIQNLKIIVGQNIVYIKVLQCSGAGVPADRSQTCLAGAEPFGLAPFETIAFLSTLIKFDDNLRCEVHSHS